MLKRNITYENFDGEEVTDVFYFNISEPELVELEVRYERGLERFIEQIVEAKDNKTLVGLFKEIILMAYGEKSEDGKRFIKSDEISEAFSQTNAFNALFMEFITDEQAAADFIIGVVPKSLSEKLITEMDNLEKKSDDGPPKPPTKSE